MGGQPGCLVQPAQYRPGYYDTVDVCLYNVYPTGSGEIIAGRVTDNSTHPLSGATVAATDGVKTYDAIVPTGSSGIYAIPLVPSATTFTVSVIKTGFSFTPRSVATGTSTNDTIITGNLWGVDFVAGGRPGMAPIYQLLLLD